MALTISELIAKKDELKEKKNRLYDLETSIGDITFKVPSSDLIADAWDMRNTMEGNAYIILECAVNPNLKDRELQEAYGVADPLDIVPMIFQGGEVPRLAGALLDLSGYNDKISKKLHKEIKN